MNIFRSRKITMRTDYPTCELFIFPILFDFKFQSYPSLVKSDSQPLMWIKLCENVICGTCSTGYVLLSEVLFLLMTAQQIRNSGFDGPVQILVLSQKISNC